MHDNKVIDSYIQSAFSISINSISILPSPTTFTIPRGVRPLSPRWLDEGHSYDNEPANGSLTD